jgi:chromosome segregation ATPase
MTEDEVRTLRLLIREETNAAVYASEERIGNHFGQLEGHMGQLEGHIGKLEDRMGRFEVRLDRIEIEQREIRVSIVKLETNLSQAISVLDDVTRVINDLQASQRALELKLEDNLVGMRKDIQRINESVHTFAREFITLHVQTNDRITWHERTPISETHPKPYSAA